MASKSELGSVILAMHPGQDRPLESAFLTVK